MHTSNPSSEKWVSIRQRHYRDVSTTRGEVSSEYPLCLHAIGILLLCRFQEERTHTRFREDSIVPCMESPSMALLRWR
jgi:hypothetical protein